MPESRLNFVGWASPSPDASDALEQTLQESHQRYSIVSKISVDYAYSFRINQDGKPFREWVTDAFTRITGYLGEDIDERGGILSIIYPEDLPLVQARIARLLQGQNDVSEYRLLSKSGETVWLRDHGWVERSQDGQLVRIYGTGHVITQEKEAEQALKASEAKFAKLFQTSPYGITITSLVDDKILDANPKFLSETGYSREDVIGKTTAEFSLWNNPEERVGFVNELRAKGSVRDFEIEYRTKSGEIKYAQLSGEFIEINGQRCLAVTSRGVTELRKAQQDLRNSEAKFARLFETSPYGIVIISLENKCILDANPAFLRDTGFERQEIVGSTTDAFGNWLSQEQWNQFLEQMQTHGMVYDFKIQYATKSGEPHYAMISGEYIELEGQRCLAVTARNITVLHNTQQALHNSEAKFSRLFETSPYGIAIISLKENRLLDANLIFLRETGFSREEIVGKTTDEFGHWIRLDQWTRLLSNLGEGISGFELEYTTKSGQRRFALLWAEPIEVGGQPCVSITARDVTDLRRAQQALRDSEAKYSTIFRRSPFAIAIGSLETNRLVDVNDNFLHRTGYSREDLIGRTSDEIGIWVNPRTRERVFQILQELGMVENLEVEFRKKSGELGICLVSAEVIELSGVKHLIYNAQDITGLRRAEHEQRLSEALFLTMFQSFPENIGIISLGDNRLLNANNNFLKTFGHVREEVIGGNITHINPIVDDEQTKEFCNRLQIEGSVKNLEVDLRVASGAIERHLISVEIAQLGQEPVMIFTGRNISYLKQAEQALRKNEALFSSVFHESPENMMLVSSQDLVLLDVNQSLLHDLEMTREEVIGKQLRDLVLFANPQEGPKFIQQLRTQRRIQNFEADLRSKTGAIQRHQIAARVVTVGEEDIFVFSGRNITEIRKAEQALQETDARFRAIFEQNAVGMTISTWNGYYIQVNQRFAEMLGYTPEELKGQCYDIFTHPNDLGNIGSYVKRLHAGEINSYSVEKRYLRKDGSVFWAKLSISRVEGGPNTKDFTVAIVEDISHRKQHLPHSE